MMRLNPRKKDKASKSAPEILISGHEESSFAFPSEILAPIPSQRVPLFSFVTPRPKSQAILLHKRRKGAKERTGSLPSSRLIGRDGQKGCLTKEIMPSLHDESAAFCAEVDENDSISVANQPLSACVEPSKPELVASSPQSASCPPTEFRSPSPVTRQEDVDRIHNSQVPLGLQIPTLESLARSITTGVSEPEVVQVAVRVLRPQRDAPVSPGEAMRFSKEMSRAFSDGTLLPYFFSLLSPPAAIQDENGTSWNGHLPLAPYPHPEETSHVQWAIPRSRRRRPEQQTIPSTESPMCSHTYFPTTLSDPEQVEILFHSNEDSSSQASDKNQPRIRRPPAAAASMSVPSSAKQAVAANAIQQTHPMVKKSPSNAAAGPDRVQIQTPGADRSALKELPALRDAPPAKREELFIMKLQLCSVIFTFDDPTADKRGKDMKRQTLLELVDYVNTPAGQKIFTESVMGDLMACISANVCRALPPATDDFDPEEDEPVLEPAWPHLQVAYEFFLRFIVSSEVNAKAAKKYVDQKFCLQLVELFDSEDPRERDYLKTILHRIYGKFMSHRSFIRRAISNVFYRFVYETERHNGIGELLEILGSIINGFAIPLKKEHLQFLVRALIPLHKPKCVALYHQQLSYCIIQYVEKDADTATPILNGFFKCWPWSCSGKQVMFLNELEEILELLGADQLAQVSTMLFTNLARCLDSDHFQVVERALFLWNNEHLVNSGCLSRLNAQTVLPIIYGPLYKNSSGHWNATVEGLAQNVLKMYMEYDLVLYDKCTAAYFREEEEAKRKLEAIQNKWASIEDMARTNQRLAIAAK